MKYWLFFLTLFFSSLAMPAADVYQFTHPEKQILFTQLTTKLRCLVCQNQNLAESNAPLATDLRGLIYRKVQAGESSQEIIQYLVQRYGDFILYDPPLNNSTIILWLGPLFIFIFSFIGLMFYLRRTRVQHDIR